MSHRLDSFKVGAAYFATPALDGQPKRLAVVLGISGSTVQVAFADELANGRIYWDSTAAMLKTSIGQYNIFAAVTAPAQDAAMVMDIVNDRR